MKRKTETKEYFVISPKFTWLKDALMMLSFKKKYKTILFNFAPIPERYDCNYLEVSWDRILVFTVYPNVRNEYI